MKVTGEQIQLKETLSLKTFLDNAGYTSGRIAVERNGDIVPKNSYEKVLLSDADTLEIVHFVGGG